MDELTLYYTIDIYAPMDWKLIRIIKRSPGFAPYTYNGDSVNA